MFQNLRFILSSILRKWDAKNAIYHIMRSVNAGESVGRKERLGRPHKLIKAQEKKGTF